MPLIPVGRRYTATVSGSAQKRVTCFSCQASYEYRLTGRAVGGATSALWLDNEGTKERAVAKARKNLDALLQRSHAPVPCPVCGNYQPNMVKILRAKHGRNYDPNAYARERAGTTDQAAWQKTRTENSKAAYLTFIDVWPHSSLTAEAHAKIYEIEGRKRERPTTRRRAIAIRVLISLIIFGGLFFLSWMMFGKRY